MPIRPLAIALPLVLSACADRPPPDESIATTFAELRGGVPPRLICDPWCDPDDPDTEVHATLGGAYNFAWATYPNAAWAGQGCIDLEPGTECLVRFKTPDWPCDGGTVTVDCTDFPTHGRDRVHCHWLPSGGCD